MCVENNKLIAEFMGGVMATNDPKCKHVSFMRKKDAISPTKEKYYSLSTLYYHSDWNWLMEVVNKCLEICHENMLNEWEQGFSDSLFSRDINCMYAESVRFIKWYNEQNK